ncbi:hypothetical protein C922_00039 [Plasmodium inui San Antonio 1]|uniref:Histone-lysine N-methyltransferase n=1 Tax=Plasmodium inui San Antonio 1 TaxID=1237626 RepID=W7AUU2_9APIC|nr:hypothetical protein C922_00039 [Plasmodium inui San Antonio 1]EUD69176.1 hypothetical protein C922_00039 [Plasmodium inui San Antonio 1]
MEKNNPQSKIGLSSNEGANVCRGKSKSRQINPLRNRGESSRAKEVNVSFSMVGEECGKRDPSEGGAMKQDNVQFGRGKSGSSNSVGGVNNYKYRKSSEQGNDSRRHQREEADNHNEHNQPNRKNQPNQHTPLNGDEEEGEKIPNDEQMMRDEEATYKHNSASVSSYENNNRKTLYRHNVLNEEQKNIEWLLTRQKNVEHLESINFNDMMKNNLFSSFHNRNSHDDGGNGIGGNRNGGNGNGVNANGHGSGGDMNRGNKLRMSKRVGRNYNSKKINRTPDNLEISNLADMLYKIKREEYRVQPDGEEEDYEMPLAGKYHRSYDGPSDGRYDGRSDRAYDRRYKTSFERPYDTYFDRYPSRRVDGPQLRGYDKSYQSHVDFQTECQMGRKIDRHWDRLLDRDVDERCVQRFEKDYDEQMLGGPEETYRNRRAMEDSREYRERRQDALATYDDRRSHMMLHQDSRRAADLFLHRSAFRSGSERPKEKQHHQNKPLNQQHVYSNIADICKSYIKNINSISKGTYKSQCKAGLFRYPSADAKPYDEPYRSGDHYSGGDSYKSAMINMARRGGRAGGTGPRLNAPSCTATNGKAVNNHDLASHSFSSRRVNSRDRSIMEGSNREGSGNQIGGNQIVDHHVKDLQPSAIPSSGNPASKKHEPGTKRKPMRSVHFADVDPKEGKPKCSRNDYRASQNNIMKRNNLDRRNIDPLVSSYIDEGENNLEQKRTKKKNKHSNANKVGDVQMGIVIPESYDRKSAKVAGGDSFLGAKSASHEKAPLSSLPNGSNNNSIAISIGNDTSNANGRSVGKGTGNRSNSRGSNRGSSRKGNSNGNNSVPIGLSDKAAPPHHAEHAGEKQIPMEIIKYCKENNLLLNKNKKELLKYYRDASQGEGLPSDCAKKGVNPHMLLGEGSSAMSVNNAISANDGISANNALNASTPVEKQGKSSNLSTNHPGSNPIRSENKTTACGRSNKHPKNSENTLQRNCRPQVAKEGSKIQNTIHPVGRSNNSSSGNDKRGTGDASAERKDSPHQSFISLTNDEGGVEPNCGSKAVGISHSNDDLGISRKGSKKHSAGGSAAGRGSISASVSAAMNGSSMNGGAANSASLLEGAAPSTLKKPFGAEKASERLRGPHSVNMNSGNIRGGNIRSGNRAGCNRQALGMPMKEEERVKLMNDYYEDMLKCYRQYSRSGMDDAKAFHLCDYCEQNIFNLSNLLTASEAKDHLYTCNISCGRTFHMKCVSHVKPKGNNFICFFCLYDINFCSLCKEVTTNDGLIPCYYPLCNIFLHTQCVEKLQLMRTDCLKQYYYCTHLVAPKSGGNVNQGEGTKAEPPGERKCKKKRNYYRRRKRYGKKKYVTLNKKIDKNQKSEKGQKDENNETNQKNEMREKPSELHQGNTADTCKNGTCVKKVPLDGSHQMDNPDNKRTVLNTPEGKKELAKMDELAQKAAGHLRLSKYICPLHVCYVCKEFYIVNLEKVKNKKSNCLFRCLKCLKSVHLHCMKNSYIISFKQKIMFCSVHIEYYKKKHMEMLLNRFCRMTNGVQGTMKPLQHVKNDSIIPCVKGVLTVTNPTSIIVPTTGHKHKRGSSSNRVVNRSGSHPLALPPKPMEQKDNVARASKRLTAPAGEPTKLGLYPFEKRNNTNVPLSCEDGEAQNVAQQGKIKPGSSQNGVIITENVKQIFEGENNRNSIAHIPVSSVVVSPNLGQKKEKEKVMFDLTDEGGKEDSFFLTNEFKARYSCPEQESSKCVGQDIPLVVASPMGVNPHMEEELPTNANRGEVPPNSAHISLPPYHSYKGNSQAASEIVGAANSKKEETHLERKNGTVGEEAKGHDDIKEDKNGDKNDDRNENPNDDATLKKKKRKVSNVNDIEILKNYNLDINILSDFTKRNPDSCTMQKANTLSKRSCDASGTADGGARVPSVVAKGEKRPFGSIGVQGGANQICGKRVSIPIKGRQSKGEILGTRNLKNISSCKMEQLYKNLLSPKTICHLYTREHFQSEAEYNYYILIKVRTILRMERSLLALNQMNPNKISEECEEHINILCTFREDFINFVIFLFKKRGGGDMLTDGLQNGVQSRLQGGPQNGLPNEAPSDYITREEKQTHRNGAEPFTPQFESKDEGKTSSCRRDVVKMGQRNNATASGAEDKVEKCSLDEEAKKDALRGNTNQYPSWEKHGDGEEPGVVVIAANETTADKEQARTPDEEEKTRWVSNDLLNILYKELKNATSIIGPTVKERTRQGLPLGKSFHTVEDSVQGVVDLNRVTTLSAGENRNLCMSQSRCLNAQMNGKGNTPIGSKGGTTEWKEEIGKGGPLGGRMNVRNSTDVKSAEILLTVEGQSNQVNENNGEIEEDVGKGKRKMFRNGKVDFLQITQNGSKIDVSLLKKYSFYLNFEYISKNVYFNDKNKNLLSCKSDDYRCLCQGECDPFSCYNSLSKIQCSKNRCNLPIQIQDKKCFNRPFRQSAIKDLEIRKTERTGYGVFCKRDIKNGELICEYVGEVLAKNEFEERLEAYQEESKKTDMYNWYAIQINRDVHIDSKRKGNISRFVNHSCSPNSVSQKWIVRGFYRIGIFAQQDIPAGEEITYNYSYNFVFNNFECLCNSANCMNYNVKKKEETDNEINDIDVTDNDIFNPMENFNNLHRKMQDWIVSLDSVETKSLYKENKMNAINLRLMESFSTWIFYDLNFDRNQFFSLRSRPFNPMSEFWKILVSSFSDGEKNIINAFNLFLPSLIKIGQLRRIQQYSYILHNIVGAEHEMWNLIDKGFADDEVCRKCKSCGNLTMCDKCFNSYHQICGNIHSKVYKNNELVLCKFCQKYDHKIKWIKQNYREQMKCSIEIRSRAFYKLNRDIMTLLEQSVKYTKDMSISAITEHNSKEYNSKKLRWKKFQYKYVKI